FNGGDGRGKEAPGTTGFPVLGETFAFIAANKSCKGVYDFVHQRHLRFGPVFKTRIFGKTHVFMPGPQVAKLVLRGEFSEFTKSYFKSMQEGVGEHSLLCVKEETHRKLRRVLGDLLSAEALAANSLSHIDSLFTLSLAQWTHDISIRITFKIMCGMLMSVEAGDEKLKWMRKDVDLVSDAMLCLPIHIPGTRYYTGIKARERLMKYFEEAIDSRRRGEEYPRHDFLQSMLADHVGISDGEVKDNILTLILAGQTTTAAAIMWAVKYLDLNPDVQHKLRVEQNTVRQRMKAEDGREHLNMEDVNTMTYTSKGIAYVSVYRWKVEDEDMSLEAWAHFPRLRNGCPVTIRPS
ncbi:hypothetical protein KI387_020006, partial [Taxus chinensis]